MERAILVESSSISRWTKEAVLPLQHNRRTRIYQRFFTTANAGDLHLYITSSIAIPIPQLASTEKKQWVHFIGIGGAGLSALAFYAIAQFPGGGSVIYGSGTTFVLEADEYDSCFLSLSPQLALITNIEWEHVDMFPNEAAVRDHFKRFSSCLKAGGTLIFCGDSEGAKWVASEVVGEELSENRGNVIRYNERQQQVISYGLGEENDWRALKIEPNIHGGSDYLAALNGKILTRVQLKLPGVHNVLNSLAVLVTAVVFTAENLTEGAQSSFYAKKGAAEAVSRSLGRFIGVRRRFEFVGTVKGCQIYDDYAHHPTEIRAVLQAAKQRFGVQPVWLIFQPHMYSRLSSLLEDFAAALAAADHVIVTEVYTNREKNVSGISGKTLVSSICGPPAVYIRDLDDVCMYLQAEIGDLQLDGSENIIILTVGAGTITNLGPKLLQALSRI